VGATLAQWFANPIVATFVSVLVGGGITWLAAWVYYKRAADDLRQGATLLKKATAAIIYFLEHPDAEIEVRRDPDGNLVGLIVASTAQAKGQSTAKGVVADAKRDS